jgi:hypothetical protein
LVLLQLLLLLLLATAQTIAPTNNTIIDPDADNVLLVFNNTRIYHTTTLAALLSEADFPVSAPRVVILPRVASGAPENRLPVRALVRS